MGLRSWRAPASLRRLAGCRAAGRQAGRAGPNAAREAFTPRRAWRCRRRRAHGLFASRGIRFMPQRFAGMVVGTHARHLVVAAFLLLLIPFTARAEKSIFDDDYWENDTEP